MVCFLFSVLNLGMGQIIDTVNSFFYHLPVFVKLQRCVSVYSLNSLVTVLSVYLSCLQEGEDDSLQTLLQFSVN